MPRWTPEAKARQAALIHEWAPWKESTGPITAEGKKAPSRNAHRQTCRKFLLIACFLLREKNKLMAGKPYASQAECERRMADNYVF